MRLQVLSAPGVSEHIDFVAKNITYEEQLEAAGKAYLDWYMLSQVQGARARKRVQGRFGFSVIAPPNDTAMRCDIPVRISQVRRMGTYT